MAVPYKVHVDLLNLDSTKYELFDSGGPDEESNPEKQDKGNGAFLQEDARQTTEKHKHEFVVLASGADAMTDTDCPRVGKHTGTSSVVYWIDSVTRGNRNKHHTIVVNFHRYGDLAASRQTMTRSDLGLT